MRVAGRVWGYVAQDPLRAEQHSVRGAMALTFLGCLLLMRRNSAAIFTVPLAMIVLGWGQIAVYVATGRDPEAARTGLLLFLVGTGAVVVGIVALLT